MTMKTTPFNMILNTDITLSDRNLTVYSDGRIWRKPITDTMGRKLKGKYLSVCKSVKGYAVVRIDNTLHYLHQILAKSFLNNPNHLPQVDHIDGDPMNNDIKNLRWVSNQQNQVGYKKKTTGTSSKYRGVSWDKSRGKWEAKLCRNKKTHHLGRFDSEIEAARAYNDSAKRMGFSSSALNQF